MLIILCGGDKLRDCNDIDNIISAEISDEAKDMELCKLVKLCMTSDPCGVINPNPASMEDGVCKITSQSNFTMKLTR